MEDNSSNAIFGSFEKEWESVEFHGEKYAINIQVSEAAIQGQWLLLFEVELLEKNSNNNINSSPIRWIGEFTSQYIEEITHKAGSFKKFSVFCKMLIGSLNKDSDNLLIDLLTAQDLETLKNRKQQHKPSSSIEASNSGNINIKQQKRRYAILTYSGEFDRVHYPLPLSLEETPSIESLQRTIRRLRRKLVKQNENLVSEKEKELRQIVSQLRQDNTELRHRLRHIPPTPVDSTNASTATVTKLRRQVEILQRDLTESSSLRDEAVDLRRRLALAERELRIERLKGMTKGQTVSIGGSGRGGGGGGSVTVTPSSSNHQSFRSTYNNSYSFRSTNSSNSNRRSLSASCLPPRSSSPLLNLNRNNYNNNNKSNNNSANRSRNPSPSSILSNNSRSRGNTPPPSSSLGGRFDPTAYHRQKLQREQDRLRTKPWGANNNNNNNSINKRYQSPSSVDSHTSQSSRGSSKRSSDTSLKSRTNRSNRSRDKDRDKDRDKNKHKSVKMMPKEQFTSTSTQSKTSINKGGPPSDVSTLRHRFLSGNVDKEFEKVDKLLSLVVDNKKQHKQKQKQKMEEELPLRKEKQKIVSKPFETNNKELSGRLIPPVIQRLRDQMSVSTSTSISTSMDSNHRQQHPEVGDDKKVDKIGKNSAIKQLKSELLSLEEDGEDKEEDEEDEEEDGLKGKENRNNHNSTTFITNNNNNNDKNNNKNHFSSHPKPSVEMTTAVSTTTSSLKSRPTIRNSSSPFSSIDSFASFKTDQNNNNNNNINHVNIDSNNINSNNNPNLPIVMDQDLDLETSDIDKRIRALQAYLDNARS